MEFEVLRDLVRIITRNKVKQIEVLGNPGQEGSRTEEFYDAISKERLTSDEEAAKYFFGTTEKDPNYRKLRNKLIRQLINTSFFIDVQQPMFNERSKAQYHCYRDYAAAFILRTRDAHKSSVYLLQQVLEQSLKFEFTELTADICRQLLTQYALTPGDQTSHERYRALHRTYEEKRYWEVKALDYHEDLIHHYITNRSTSKEIHQLATTYLDELMPLSDKIDTIQFYLFVFSIAVVKYLSVNDCQMTIHICDQALEIIQKRKSSYNGALISFAIQKLACLTQLRVFDDEDEIGKFCLSLVEEGGFNWFRVMELQFYNRIYAKKYAASLNVFTTAVQHPRHALLSGSVRDVWTLCGGYLHLLAKLGQIDSKKVESIVGFFRPVKFQNDFEVMDKEKAGMNIPLILLPVMHSIATGAYEDEFGRSIEALDKYRKRYLENDTNRRSAIFLKMLLALAKKEFEGSQAERKMEKEWAQLKQLPPQMAGQNFAVEIIPYEDLWEMLTQKSVKI